MTLMDDDVKMTPDEFETEYRGKIFALGGIKDLTVFIPKSISGNLVLGHRIRLKQETDVTTCWIGEVRLNCGTLARFHVATKQEATSLIEQLLKTMTDMCDHALSELWGYDQ